MIDEKAKKRLQLKQIIGLIVVSLIFVLLVSGDANSMDVTQVVVTIPNLNSFEIQKQIEKEFSSLNGMNCCKSSLVTHTLTLQYNDQKIKRTDIEKILLKWGCEPERYSFNKLINHFVEG